MIKYTKALIIFLAVVLLSWLLPWCYHFIFSKPFESPLTLYSCVTHDFLTYEFQKENVGGYDMEGNSYTPEEFDSLMPTVNYFQLYRAGRLPKEIEGMPYRLHQVEHSNFVFRSFPKNYNRPETGLYQMFDGATIETGIEIPDDVFRMTKDGLEFITMEDNEIDQELSDRFTTALLNEGFVFPARYLDYDDDIEKKYDNGFLLLDQVGHLFQLKRVNNEPICRSIHLPDSIHFTHTFVTEYKDKKLLGFLRDENGGFYALENKDLSLHRIPIAPFDPNKDQMVISGDLLYWNVIREAYKYEHIDAINARDYSYVKSHETHFPIETWEKARDYFFPYILTFSSSSDRFIQPRLSAYHWKSLFMNLVLALAYFFLQKRYGRDKFGNFATIGVFVLGWYLFIPLVLTLRK